jgi:signal transduction histidine kinase
MSRKGPGISADRLEEVFESLFTTKTEGMGMGLAIARTIIQAHDGRIWAESLDGARARFRIMLPFRKAAADFDRAA